MVNPERNEDIILYRGESPGAIGMDIHGGYGETWTTDPAHAAQYALGQGGHTKQAILPSTAKRLVLIYRNEHGVSTINWNAVDTLQQITGDLDLRRMIELMPMYEAWCDEWTVALINAGYDSIATEGFEGIEEYVLNKTVLIASIRFYEFSSI